MAGLDGDPGSAHVHLRRYDAAGNLAWAQSPTPGWYNGVTVDPATGSIFAVGRTPGSSPDFLAEKWDANGNLLWSRTYDRNAASDELRGVSVLDGRLFAVGTTGGGTAGGTDGAVLELDPDTGDLIDTILWGGTADDSFADVAASPQGGYLYVIGSTSSIGSGGSDLAHVVYQVASANQPPTADAGEGYSVAEGGIVPLDGLGTDPDGDALTYAWDLDNDGSFETAGQSVTFSAVGLDGPGTATVRLQVTDSYGLTAEDEAIIEIENVAPIVDPITVPGGVFQIGSSVESFNASFTDPGILDTHMATWDWGDGTSSVGNVSESGGSGTVTGDHAYTVAGVYTVRLTVSDGADSTQVVALDYVVVYDPSAGFVTGGGWITSPLGAVAADPTLTGKANFGFVSRYRNGSSRPTGNAEFQFKLADFNFKSTDYEWLVVSGAKARFRGVGTVNGAGSFGFELTAWDGQANGGGGTDRFRIKIWSNNQGNGVVYDNMMGAADGADPTTALGGGSIVIHRDNSTQFASYGPGAGLLPGLKEAILISTTPRPQFPTRPVVAPLGGSRAPTTSLTDPSRPRPIDPPTGPETVLGREPLEASPGTVDHSASAPTLRRRLVGLALPLHPGKA